MNLSLSTKHNESCRSKPAPQWMAMGTDTKDTSYVFVNPTSILYTLGWWAAWIGWSKMWLLAFLCLIEMHRVLILKWLPWFRSGEAADGVAIALWLGTELLTSWTRHGDRLDFLTMNTLELSKHDHSVLCKNHAFIIIHRTRLMPQTKFQWRTKNIFLWNSIRIACILCFQGFKDLLLFFFWNLVVFVLERDRIKQIVGSSRHFDGQTLETRPQNKLREK